MKKRSAKEDEDAESRELLTVRLLVKGIRQKKPLMMR